MLQLCFCFLLVVFFGSHSDIPKPCPLGVLDILDSILESEYGPILEMVKSSLLDCRFVPMAKCQQLSLSFMISGWLIAQQ